MPTVSFCSRLTVLVLTPTTSIPLPLPLPVLHHRHHVISDLLPQFQRVHYLQVVYALISSPVLLRQRVHCSSILTVDSDTLPFTLEILRGLSNLVIPAKAVFDISLLDAL